VTSLTETLSLLDANIDDGQVARVAPGRFYFEEEPVRRQMACGMRHRLKLIYRPALQAQDLRPDHVVMPIESSGMYSMVSAPIEALLERDLVEIARSLLLRWGAHSTPTSPCAAASPKQVCQSGSAVALHVILPSRSECITEA
jgi:hypothetical protein